jgi:peptide/nickel transport system permease protein
MGAVGIAGIAFLLSVAVFAPLIANGRPLLLVRNGAVSFPALAFIFAPDSTEPFVERFFNYLLLATPLALAAFWMFRSGARRSLWIPALLAVALIVPFVLAKQRMDKTDWREKVALEKCHAFFAPVPYGPFENVAEPYSPPSEEHLLGTDKIGRDVLARMLYGARVSLAVGLFATGITIVIGTIIGLSSGFFGGKFDLIVMRIVEVVICFPTFLLLLILMSIMMDKGYTQSILLVIAVIGLTGWTGLSRITRGETLRLRSMPFVMACESLAIPTWRVMLFHLLPNIIGPIMINFAFGIAGAIIAESSLSFLGFGVQAPTASWGELLRQAFEDPFAYWHLTLWPGLALLIAVVSFNFAGESLRRAIDPKSS